MVHPSILWALRNREPLAPGEARALRHAGFWALFVSMQTFAYDLVAPELVIVAAVAAIFARTSFIAMHAALIVSMSMSAWQTHDATLIADLFVLVVLAAAPRNRATNAALLLLHSIALFVDPWCIPTSSLTSAHFVARAMAIVMCTSMLFSKKIAIVATPPAVTKSSPLSAAEWDRASR